MSVSTTEGLFQRDSHSADFFLSVFESSGDFQTLKECMESFKVSDWASEKENCVDVGRVGRREEGYGGKVSGRFVTHVDIHGDLDVGKRNVRKKQIQEKLREICIRMSFDVPVVYTEEWVNGTVSAVTLGFSTR